MEGHPKKLRVAISGGGLAGVTLLNGLLQHPHISVQIFESAASFSERGAAVSLGINAQNALREINPAVQEAVKNAGAIPYNSSRALIGSGPNAGTVVIELKGDDSGQGVHRAAFLSELLKPLPKDIMHTSKKVVQIDESDDGGVILHFKDGTEQHFDALIGADGIHGYCREYILGAEHPASKPAFAGFWDCRALVPIQKAKKVLGEEYFMDGKQYAWIGDGGYLMHDVLDNGETVQCVSSMMTDEIWNPGEWKRDLDRKGLKDAFSKWTNSPIVKGMVQLLGENPDLRAYSQWEHSVDAPTYTRGRVCIMGDAAHAMTPWQGSGAGTALEDAMILETLLEAVKEPRQINAAFYAYDQVRRQRTQEILKSSKTTGQIFCGRGPGIGLDPEKLRESLAPRWNFIYGFNMKDHKKNALKIFAAM